MADDRLGMASDDDSECELIFSEISEEDGDGGDYDDMGTGSVFAAEPDDADEQVGLLHFVLLARMNESFHVQKNLDITRSLQAHCDAILLCTAPPLYLSAAHFARPSERNKLVQKVDIVTLPELKERYKGDIENIMKMMDLTEGEAWRAMRHYDWCVFRPLWTVRWELG